MSKTLRDGDIVRIVRPYSRHHKNTLALVVDEMPHSLIYVRLRYRDREHTYSDRRLQLVGHWDYSWSDFGFVFGRTV